MPKLPKRLWIGSVSLMLVLAAAAFLFFEISRAPSHPIELIWAGWSREIPGHILLRLTNQSVRPIAFSIPRREIECDGVWKESFAIAMSDDDFTPIGWIVERSTTSGNVHTLFYPGPPTRLAPGAGITALVPRPIQIQSGDAARAWRVSVGWNYTQPSRLEAFQDRVIQFVTRKPRTFTPVLQTNHTAAFKL